MRYISNPPELGGKARGFAQGAVLAAEWIATRKGVFGFDAVLADLAR